MWRAFFGSVIAVLVVQVLHHAVVCRILGDGVLTRLLAQFIDPMNTGKVVVFEGDFSSNWKVFELVPFLVTAALGGLCGALFIKLNLRLCQYRKTSAMAKYAIRRRRHRPVLDRLCLLTIICCMCSSRMAGTRFWKSCVWRLRPR
jgi:H+/Cl- antiporter ClcA